MQFWVIISSSRCTFHLVPIMNYKSKVLQLLANLHTQYICTKKHHVDVRSEFSELKPTSNCS